MRQPNLRETAAALGVIAVLVAIAIWLAITQARFSPAVLVANAQPAAAPRAKNVAASVASASTLITPLPATLRPMGAVEGFAPDTLSDKIDGKAELYLAAGFVGMRCQRLAINATPGAWFEASIYDMGTPENAFAVYSSQKRNETQPEAIGDYSYRASNQLCVVHGQYYLEVVGADNEKSTVEAATQLAGSFVSTTAVARHANVQSDEALFPAEAQIAGSVMLLSSDVFGFDQLNHTYVARYRDGNETATLFLSRRATPAEAAQLGAAYRRFLTEDCGAKPLDSVSIPPGAAIFDSSGAFEAVLVRGAFVAGVHESSSTKAAARWLEQLSARLGRASP